MLRAAGRVVCGMSGGVDSAVSALLLKQKGYEVIGLFMKNWDIRDEKGQCSSASDKEDAEFVCKTLNIPLFEVDFIKQYWHDVFSDLLHDYQSGFTPNPDILCNRHIKFHHFINHSISKLNADFIATGHYAKTSLGYDLEKLDSEKGVSLMCAADEEKDQTFFLSQIKQKALQHCIFPLGELQKSEVKRLAYDSGMERIAQKKESMGICFIGSRNFHSFIEEYIEPRPGNFIDVENGQIVGQHKGTHYWTLGQRCHIPGKVKAYFVCEVQPQTSTVLVALGTDHPALFTTSFVTNSCHWIQAAPESVASSGTFAAKFRFQHKHPLIDCVATVEDDGSLMVSLSRPMRAITPGQYAVFYKDNVCLGSARIQSRGPTLYELDMKESVNFTREFS